MTRHRSSDQPENRGEDSPEAHDRIAQHVKNDAKRWWYLVWAVIALFVIMAVISTSFLILLGKVQSNTEDAQTAAHKANVAAVQANETAAKVNALAARTDEAARHSTIALCSLTQYLDTVITQSKKLIAQDPDPARRSTRLKQLVLTDSLLAEMKSSVGNDCPRHARPNKTS